MFVQRLENGVHPNLDRLVAAEHANVDDLILVDGNLDLLPNLNRGENGIERTGSPDRKADPARLEQLHDLKDLGRHIRIPAICAAAQRVADALIVFLKRLPDRVHADLDHFISAEDGDVDHLVVGD